MLNNTNLISEWIINKTDYDTWIEFCRKFGGQRWWIPTTPALSDRDKEIKREYCDIISIPGIKKNIVLNNLAVKYRVSNKTIIRIIDE